MTNAAKFTPAGGRVRIDCFATDDAVTVEVSDSGIEGVSAVRDDPDAPEGRAQMARCVDDGRVYNAKNRQFVERTHTYLLRTRPDPSYMPKPITKPTIAVIANNISRYVPNLSFAPPPG